MNPIRESKSMQNVVKVVMTIGNGSIGRVVWSSSTSEKDALYFDIHEHATLSNDTAYCAYHLMIKMQCKLGAICIYEKMINKSTHLALLLDSYDHSILQ